MNQQPRQGGSWQPSRNRGPNSNWGTANPNSNWGAPQVAPGVNPGSVGNGGQWGGASAPVLAAGQRPAEASPSGNEQVNASDKKQKKAPLAAWPVFAQIALALVLAAFALFAFSYLQNTFGGLGLITSYVFIQFGLYAGLGLVYVLIRWLSTDTRPFLWAAFLAVVWMSVYFLRLDNRPWMLGILVLLAGVVFPIGLLFMGIIADVSKEKLGRVGAYFLSLLVPLVVFALFSLFYYIATGQSSGGQEITVPWLAPVFRGVKDLSIIAILGKFPLGQFLAFTFVASIYIPTATHRSATND